MQNNYNNYSSNNYVEQPSAGAPIIEHSSTGEYPVAHDKLVQAEHEVLQHGEYDFDPVLRKLFSGSTFQV